MTTPQSTETPIYPRCPHCAAELPGLGCFNWSQPPWIILAVFCGACLKTLDFQMVPMLPDQEERRIARPS